VSVSLGSAIGYGCHGAISESQYQVLPTAKDSCGIYANYLDKNLSGKSDEREVKICKNRDSTLHPSFFILRKLRFLTPIPYL